MSFTGGQQKTGARQATPFMQEISNNYKVYELKGKMFYPSIITPSTQSDGYQEFSLDLVFDIHENAQVVAQLNGLVTNTINKYYPQVPDVLRKLPIVDHRIARYDGKQHPSHKAGKFSTRPHTKVERAPRIIVADASDPRGYRDFTPLQDSHKVYDGADCWVSVKMGAVEGASGKYGATIYLNGVCLLGTGDKVEMRSGESVEDIFTNFLGKTSGAPQAPQQGYNAPQNNQQGYNPNGQRQAPQHGQYGQQNMQGNGQQYNANQSPYQPQQGQQGQGYNPNQGNWNGGNGQQGGGLV
jgi:hypothetical protein